MGERFGRGERYLRELSVAGKSMQAAPDIAELILASRGQSSHLGTLGIGTVQGYIHDIGKNLFVMLRGRGWSVTTIDTHPTEPILGMDLAPVPAVERGSA